MPGGSLIGAEQGGARYRRRRHTFNVAVYQFVWKKIRSAFYPFPYSGPRCSRKIFPPDSPLQKWTAAIGMSRAAGFLDNVAHQAGTVA
jgi:hypothetical protein